MGALYQVSNGVDAWDEEDVNQIITALSNQFGLTDTVQTALGRLVVPQGTSNPASPSTGEVWFRTDIGGGGRLYVRHGNSQSVPYLPIRQIQLSNILAAAVTPSTSYGNVFTNLTFATTGGDIIMRLVKASSDFDSGGGSPAAGAIRTRRQGGVVGWPAQFKFIMDSASVGECGFGSWNGDATNTLTTFFPPSNFEAYVTGVSAGSHTFNLQALAQSGDVLVIGTGIALQVIELGN